MSDRTGRFGPEQRARSFGPVAADYARGRPGYPPDAARWALGAGTPGTVLDLGAGTGKLAAAIAALELAPPPALVAVEPDPAMRTHLARVVPTARVVAGSAEAVPLADASVDAVVAGQAWHWFHPTRAAAEAARVLVPGGTVAALWNWPDEREPWVARYAAIIGAAHGPEPPPRTFAGVVDGAAFERVEDARFEHVVELAADDLLALGRSNSFVALLPPAEQADVLAQLAALAREAAVDGVLAMPFRLVAVRARRR